LEVETLYFETPLDCGLFNRDTYLAGVADVLGLTADDFDVLSAYCTPSPSQSTLPPFKRSIQSAGTIDPGNNLMKIATVMYSWHDHWQTPANKLAHILDQHFAMLDSQFTKIGLKPLQVDHAGSCDQWANCPCNANYLPGDCTVSALCPNNCSTHGSCVNGPFDRVCVCDAGWQGRDCSYTECPNNCYNQGSCVVVEENKNSTCQCDQGFAGTECQVKCPNRCSGHGTCTASYSDTFSRRGTCTCESGFTADDCSKVVYIPSKQITITNSVTEPQKVAVTVVAVVFGFLLLLAIGVGLLVFIRHRNSNEY